MTYVIVSLLNEERATTNGEQKKIENAQRKKKERTSPPNAVR